MANKLDISKGGIFSIGENKSASTGGNDVSASASTSGGIKINKRNFKESRTQVGWRLNSSTVAKIQELAFESRMGINEFVQELLDKALKDIDIE